MADGLVQWMICLLMGGWYENNKKLTPVGNSTARRKGWTEAAIG
jgi:hypothetical protein